MIHSADGGATWRSESLPDMESDHGPMTVAIVDSRAMLTRMMWPAAAPLRFWNFPD